MSIEDRVAALRAELAPVGAAVAAIARGEMVVVVDSPDRENEGDLVLAAEHVTPEAINFMATHGRGLICVALERGRLDELGIPPMVAHATDPRRTAFHVGVDSRRFATISKPVSNASVIPAAKAHAPVSPCTRPKRGQRRMPRMRGRDQAKRLVRSTARSSRSRTYSMLQARSPVQVQPRCGTLRLPRRMRRWSADCVPRAR